MSVDISKIKPGDEVTVRLTVAGKIEAPGGWNKVFADTAGDLHSIHVVSIVSHAPRPLRVGDKVRQWPDDQHGEVLGLHGVQAWVRWGVNDFATTYAEGLERVDA